MRGKHGGSSPASRSFFSTMMAGHYSKRMRKHGTQSNFYQLYFNASVFLAFLIGILVGQRINTSKKTVEPEYDRETIPNSLACSLVQRLETIPARPTSHQDDQGRPITKQQLIEPFLIPRLAGISVATLLPGQRVKRHQHGSMVEFFLILEGTGTFIIGNSFSKPKKEYSVSPGSFVQCWPHDIHEIIVSEKSLDGPLKLFVVGVALDSNQPDGTK